MTFPQAKQRPNFPVPKEQGNVIVDMSKGESTEIEEDKQKFEAFRKMVNFIGDAGNGEVRRGISQLADIDNLLGCGMYKLATETKLMGMVQTVTTSKLVEISRVDGSITDRVTGIVGTGTPDFDSLRNYQYVVNGESDIVAFSDPSTDSTIVLPSSEIAKFITNDGTRIWVATNEGTLRGSTLDSDIVTSFTPTGTDISRAFIANTSITNFSALASSGAYVCAAGDGIVQIFKVPAFAESGITTFPSDSSVLVKNSTYEGIVLEGKDSIVGVGNVFYVKDSKSGVLFLLIPGNPQPKPIRSNDGAMDLFDYDKTALTYDAEKKLIYIACRDADWNNKIFFYDLLRDSFGEMDNLFVKEWFGDKDGLYFRSSVDNKIHEAFAEDQFTDNGQPIDFLIETVSSYAGTQDFYKKATREYHNIQTWSSTEVLYEFLADQKIGGENVVYSRTIELLQSSNPFIAGNPSFDSVFGASRYEMTTGENLNTESFESKQRINKQFWRGSARMSGSVSNRFRLRGLGFSSEITTKKVPKLTLS